MSEYKLAAENRSEAGKGAARAACAPPAGSRAVLYGHGAKPEHLSVDARQFGQALRTDAGVNVLIELEVGKTRHLALAKEIQRHSGPGRPHPRRLHPGPAGREGPRGGAGAPGREAPGPREGGIADQDLYQLNVEAEVTAVPEAVEADVSGLGIGDVLRVADLKAFEGAVILDDPEASVVSVVAPAVEPEPEVEEAAEGEAAEAEGEAPAAEETGGEGETGPRPAGGAAHQAAQPAAAEPTAPTAAPGSCLGWATPTTRATPTPATTPGRWWWRCWPRRAGATLKRSRNRAQVAEIRDGDARVVLARPNSYVNESGGPASLLARWYKTPVGRIIVVHDEIDLAYGKLQVRRDGGTAGHNGLKDVAKALGSPDFLRVRIGIGRPLAARTRPTTSWSRSPSATPRTSRSWSSGPPTPPWTWSTCSWSGPRTATTTEPGRELRASGWLPAPGRGRRWPAAGPPRRAPRRAHRPRSSGRLGRGAQRRAALRGEPQELGPVVRGVGLVDRQAARARTSASRCTPWRARCIRRAIRHRGRLVLDRSGDQPAGQRLAGRFGQRLPGDGEAADEPDHLHDEIGQASLAVVRSGAPSLTTCCRPGRVGSMDKPSYGPRGAQAESGEEPASYAQQSTLPTPIRPFRIDIPQADSDDLRERLARTKARRAAPGRLEPGCRSTTSSSWPATGPTATTGASTRRG